MTQSSKSMSIFGGFTSRAEARAYADTLPEEVMMISVLNGPTGMPLTPLACCLRLSVTCAAAAPAVAPPAPAMAPSKGCTALVAASGEPSNRSSTYLHSQFKEGQEVSISTGTGRD